MVETHCWLEVCACGLGATGVQRWTRIDCSRMYQKPRGGAICLDDSLPCLPSEFFRLRSSLPFLFDTYTLACVDILPLLATKRVVVV